MSDTISVRVPHEVKKRLQELGINASEAVRSCLLSIIQKEESLKKLEEVDRELGARALKTPKGTAETLIRDDRDLEH